MSKINHRVLVEAALFGVSGFVGYLVDSGVTTVLIYVMSPYLARIPGFISAATVTWFINRNITFKNRNKRYDKLYKEYLHYMSLMAAGAAVNYGTYAICVVLFGSFPLSTFVYVAIGSLAGMLVNFITSRKYVFS